MSETASLTIDLPRELLASLESIAECTGREVSALAAEALAEYVDLQQWQINAIAEAVAEADSGAPMIAHEDVMAWMESWETPNELPPPR